jgi:hypothetical protein
VRVLELAAAALLVVILCSMPASAAATSPFADWAVVVVSGDFHSSHTNNPTETFDNARRDVAAELIKKGFSPGNLLQFSVRPERYPDVHPGKSDPEPIYEGLKVLAQKATGGCLVYFTSHGAPQGVLVGDHILPPHELDEMVTDACGDRPIVVIVSACFSGVFVPVLEGPNRMVLTAARPDRSSFGCSESDKYPYFDACMLQVLPDAHDFVALGPKVQACVANRETETGMKPPSEPQVSVGPQLRFTLPLMAFAPG